MVVVPMPRAPYDPVKAHQYYLRTRQLKGRRKGSPTYTVRSGGHQVRLTGQQLTEQRAYAAKRVSDIKNRLGELKATFNKLLAEAHKKEAKSKREEAKSKREAKKAPTAAEKSKAARESKKYEKKHKTELATKRKTASKKEPTKSKAERDPVAVVGRKINQAEDRLRAAVAKQRALAAATRNG